MRAHREAEVACERVAVAGAAEPAVEAAKAGCQVINLGRDRTKSSGKTRETGLLLPDRCRGDMLPSAVGLEATRIRETRGVRAARAERTCAHRKG
jgi:hypothetical protein